MSRKSRKAKVSRVQHHQRTQREQREEALAEVTAKAKRQRKGPKFIVTEMEKRGYVPTRDGDWRRLSKFARGI